MRCRWDRSPGRAPLARIARPLRRSPGSSPPGSVGPDRSSNQARLARIARLPTIVALGSLARPRPSPPGSLVHRDAGAWSVVRRPRHRAPAECSLRTHPQKRLTPNASLLQTLPPKVSCPPSRSSPPFWSASAVRVPAPGALPASARHPRSPQASVAPRPDTSPPPHRHYPAAVEAGRLAPP